jgi:hypothetical protein
MNLILIALVLLLLFGGGAGYYYGGHGGNRPWRITAGRSPYLSLYGTAWSLLI